MESIMMSTWCLAFILAPLGIGVFRKLEKWKTRKFKYLTPDTALRVDIKQNYNAASQAKGNMANVAKLVKDQLVVHGVHWCPFFALIAEEASKKGWATQVIVDVVTQLHGLGLCDHDTFMQAQAGDLRHELR